MCACVYACVTGIETSQLCHADLIREVCEMPSSAAPSLIGEKPTRTHIDTCQSA